MTTFKRASAVLIAEKKRRGIQETLYLFSIPGMRESIRKGLKISANRCSKELEW